MHFPFGHHTRWTRVRLVMAQAMLTLIELATLDSWGQQPQMCSSVSGRARP